MKTIPLRPLPLTVQLLHLRRRFPEGDGAIVRDRLTWDCWIQPHLLSHRYLCRVEHKLRDYPTVCCLEPKLTDLAAGRRLPHVYSSNAPVCMCLFMRTRECWNDGMSLANLVVPLAFFWLAQFEDWLYSGIWRGGGTHEIRPDPPAAIPVFSEELLPLTSEPSL